MNNSKLIAVMALCVAVMCISVGFAALSSTLNINGNAKVNTSNWDVHFADLSSSPTIVGDADQIKAPNLNATSITNYSVNLNEPDSSISYSFKIVNGGTYDAKISSITVPVPMCTGNGTYATSDASNVCKYLEYTLKYDNGSSLAVGDTISAGSSVNAVLKLAFTSNNNTITSVELPNDDVVISNLGISIIYVQA